MVMTAYNNLHPWESDCGEAQVKSFNELFKGQFALITPKGVTCLVLGGPYRNIPKSDMIGIKMAEEINKPCHIDIPTGDFSVPDVETLRRGLIKAMVAIAKGKTLYIGCMGGVGRTGLFIAALFKIYRPEEDPIHLTRMLYLTNAIETKEQQQYIKDLNVYDLIDLAQLT